VSNDPGFSLSAFAPVERGDFDGGGHREPTESNFAMLGEFSPPPSEQPHLLWIEMDPSAQLPPLDGAACRVDVVTLPSEQDLSETLQSSQALVSAITMIHPGEDLLASTLAALLQGQKFKSEPWLVLADTPSQDDMLQAIEAGISDMLPYDYACTELLRSDSMLADPGSFPLTAQGVPVSSISADQAMQRMMTNADFYAQLLQAFYEEIPERMQTLREVWPGDVGQVKHHCHSVVGIALSLGLDALADVAREAERYANSVIKAEGELQDNTHLVRMLGVMQSARYQMLLWMHAQVRDSSM
jgi:HPt (histidine-containing phosphotransfer) domain-containing protein